VFAKDCWYMNWYTSLPRKTRVTIGLVGLLVGSLGIYLDSRVTDDNASKTLGEVMREENKSKERSVKGSKS
jgi:hypothetical protein